ncbi:MAG: hypothetical protein AB7I50_17765 [Vicinamibacterales bacterium]
MHNTWTLGANDPGFIGWATTGAYLAAAALCCVRGWGARLESPTSPSRGFWFASSVLLVGLGVNKQLDLQTPFIALAREVATSEGWYAHRQVVRWVFLSCVAIGSLVLATRIVQSSRLPADVYGPVACGFFLLLAFVVIRASPIHHVNSVFGLDVSWVAGKRHALELAGVFCVAAGAAASARR